MASQTLITGATGFIGRQLTRDLASRGDKVRVLARNPGKACELFGDHVEICTGDVTQPETLVEACRDIDTVYHIAGIYRFGFRHRHTLWAANVTGTENVLQAAADAHVGKVVHLSSGGVLGNKDASYTRLIDEMDFPATAPRFCFYKASKWHSEQIALSWAKRGLNVSIASTTCPIGHGDEAPTPTGRIVRDFLRGEFPFYCRTGLNFIGVGDLSNGLQAVAESGRSGERYLLCDENLWLKDFLDLLSLETDLPAPRMCLPQTLIEVISFGGEAFDLLNPRSTGARVCVETALQAKRVQFFSNAKAREELGWKPVASLRENVSEAVAWFRHETESELTAATPSPVQTHVQ